MTEKIGSAAEVKVRIIGGKFHVEILREARFVVFGLCVAIAVLFPGLLFYKSLISSASEVAAASVDSSVRSNHQNLLNQIRREIEFVTSGRWSDPSRKDTLRINRDLSAYRPFDLTLLFDSERKVLDAIKLSRQTRHYSSVTYEDASEMIPVDSSFFDAVRDGEVVSGLIEIEGEPMVTAIQEVHGQGMKNFLLIARALDTSQLAVHDARLHETEFAEVRSSDDFKVFSLSDEAALPNDVRLGMAAAMQNHGWAFSLNGSSGELYTVIDDLLRRPVILVKSPWNLPGYISTATSYKLFFMVSVAAGVATWWLLRRSDEKSRSRSRRFEGLSGLSTDNLRIFVEAFPGFAFAVTPDLKYLAVSRILAGVTGQESSEFKDQTYGDVCFENDDGSLARVLFELRDQGYWPPVRNVEHSVSGLGESHSFLATAHYLAKQSVLLVILTKKESAQPVRFPEPNQRSRNSDSAVA